MASQYKPKETDKQAVKIDRPSYGPAQAARNTIEQVARPFQGNQQQQGLRTALSEASLAGHEHGVDAGGQMMLDRWLMEGSSKDPYNAIDTVFAEARAPYNVKAKKRRSDTAARGTM